MDISDMHEISFFKQKSPSEESSRKSGDINVTDIREIECKAVDWVGLAQKYVYWKTFVNKLMKGGMSYTCKLLNDQLMNYLFFKKDRVATN
jgi:hypothetical protein